MRGGKELTWVAAALALVASASAAVAQPTARTGDPTAGRTLARQLCATCHDIGAEPRPTVANADIVSFPQLAARAGLTAEQLAGRIIIPHPAMPDTQLKVSEIRDIIAYILSLKP